MITEEVEGVTEREQQQQQNGEQQEESSEDAEENPPETTSEQTNDEQTTDVKTLPHPHPYHDQLKSFKPWDWQLLETEPQQSPPLEETPFTWVDTPHLLVEMMVKLQNVKEIGVFIEHYNYKSFVGLSCIVSISTRREDFLIDALVLKEELNVLNQVFTDDGVLKVFINADRVIDRLQKDFGVFVVNMFDCHKAARVLYGDAGSIATALKRHCSIDVNIALNRHDWRIRPLTEDMIVYIRTDVHYLLYMHDVLRNELLAMDEHGESLERVYRESTTTCRQLFGPDSDPLAPDAYVQCYKKIRGRLNIQQYECFRLLYEWRHHLSKKRDEGTGYTCPHRMLMKLSKALPRSVDAVRDLLHPMPDTEVTRDNCEEIIDAVQQAIANVPEVTPENNKVPIKDLSIIFKNKDKVRTYCRNCRKHGHTELGCSVIRFQEMQAGMNNWGTARGRGGRGGGGIPGRGSNRIHPYNDMQSTYGDPYAYNDGQPYNNEEQQYNNPHSYNNGQRYDDNGQRYINDGQPYNNDGQRYNIDGQSYNNDGQRYNNDGQRYNNDGQRYNNDGQRYNNDGQRYNNDGQRYNNDGQRYNNDRQRYNNPQTQQNSGGRNDIMSDFYDYDGYGSCVNHQRKSLMGGGNSW